MTSSGPKEYSRFGEMVMPLGLDTLLALAPHFPAAPPAEEADQKLNIAVVFTSVRETLAALKEAGDLASHLNGRITLAVPELVPYPLPLDTPQVLAEFSENRFRVT